MTRRQPHRTDGALLTGWLIALLAEKPSYGYDLRVDLQHRGVRTDGASVYRALRRLDADGLLRSQWGTSSNGPRRRVYGVTDAGLEHLATVTREVEAQRAALSEFLRAVRSAKTGG